MKFEIMYRARNGISAIHLQTPLVWLLVHVNFQAMSSFERNNDFIDIIELFIGEFQAAVSQTIQDRSDFD